MTSTEWAPFGLTEDEEAAYLVLVDGVPPLMREALLGWTSSRLRASGKGPEFSDRRLCLELQTVLGVSLGVSAGISATTQSAEVRTALRKVEPLGFLRVVDYLLSRLDRYGLENYAPVLEGVLQQSRSRWTVGERMGKPGLVERVPAGVQDAVESVIANAAGAGRLLARAWARVHGLTPDDSAAYFDAVRAVEAVAIPLVIPRQREPVLGHVIGQMKNDGDWRLPLREHGDAPTAGLILGMLRALYRGHHDRHGAVDYTDVTHDEAAVAVLLAATLVGWFASGAIMRRPEA